jgi:SRSO17 transposase
LQRSEQRQNAHRYVAGLLSDLEAKNAEAIAYLHNQDRQPLQSFIGQSPWDHRPLLSVLGEQVASQLGAPDGVLVFDPSAFPKKGTESVGVQRQWCGRLGKVENCQVGVYMGYVSRVEHALVDVRLYLPKEWARGKARRKKAGVPSEIRFRTRHELALEMLDQNGALLPHAWVSGDDEMGRSTQFRQDLRGRHEPYLLAVPSNTLVRDLAAEPPPYRGRGPRPQVPFQRVARWSATLSADAWTTIDVRDGEKGPLVVQAVKARVLARTEQRRAGIEETLVVFREQQGDGSWKHDYLLSNAPLETSLAEFARVFKAQHRIEECLQRAKGEAGLADYEVRTWEGWHHHQTLSLIATWFLTQEARRGKNLDSRPNRATGAFGDRKVVAARVGLRSPIPHSSHHESSFTPHRGSSFLPLEETQPLSAQTV